MLRPEDQVSDHMPLVYAIARKIARRMPSHVDVDDLAQYGALGLLDALEKFEPGKGVKFGSYASHRIRGAILDGLRSEDWLPRKARDMADVDPDSAPRMHLVADVAEQTAPDDPATAVVNRDRIESMKHRLAEALSTLDERSTLILIGVYARGETLETVGLALGFTASRATQLHRLAMVDLAQALGGEA